MIFTLYWIQRDMRDSRLTFLFESSFRGFMDSCDTRTRAYKNGKTFDQCKEIAEKISSNLAKKINDLGEVSWTEILEVSEHDELVYKLTLKYLRRDGFNIGDWKMPKVTKTT